MGKTEIFSEAGMPGRKANRKIGGFEARISVDYKIRPTPASRLSSLIAFQPHSLPAFKPLTPD